MSWLTANIVELFADVIESVIEYFGEMLNNIFYWIIDTALENPYAENARTFIIATALGLIVLVVIKIVISGYLMETDYDSEEDPFNLIVKIAETVAVITNSGWIFEYLLELSRTFTEDMLGSIGTAGYADTAISSSSSVVGEFCATTANILLLVESSFGFVFMLLIIVIAVIIFSIIAGLRGAELIAMNLFLPFFALDLLTNSRERWGNFFMAYIMAFFTYAIQIMFFFVALNCYASSVTGAANYMLQTLIWIIMAIKAPGFLEKYLYKSGVSNAASSGLRMMAQTALMKGMIAA